MDSEKVAAQLAVQVVVTVAQFHHPRARELQRTITHLFDELGLRERAEWHGLIAAFETFARELSRHMRDEEAEILDRAQFLMVRQQLTPGAMSDARTSFDALMEEHERMGALRRRLERELAQTISLSPEPGATALRAAVREFIAAFVDHHDFEAWALTPALAPFLDER